VQPRHPIRLISRDDLERSRLTVFFRLLLAIPHLLWATLWTIAVVFSTIFNWFITLSQGRSSDGLHRFAANYLRYVTQVKGYVYLGANPYPEFGDWGGPIAAYPIDLEIDPPAPQNRWKTGFRIVLVLPALLIGSALGAFRAGTGYFDVGFGALAVASVLAWFAILARGRMPQGLSRLIAFCLSYSAQVSGYVLLLTDRYPDCDPRAVALPAAPAPPLALRLVEDETDDLVRTRVTVFFRLLLAIPLILWLLLWSIVAIFALIANWFATLFTGRAPNALHDFIGSFVRFRFHLAAYLLLLADPYPGFLGRPASYRVDVEIDPPQTQNRWRTFFRLPLALPAVLLSGALGSAAAASALLGWFAILATGRMPRMLLNLGLLGLAYQVQSDGFVYLLTERYPYSWPVPAGEQPPGATSPTELPTSA
jgi:hypothetical protein